MRGLSSLLSGLGYNARNRGTVALAELDERDDSVVSLLSFQYFPETISDSLTPVWSKKNIPGGSLPIHQYSGGSGRTISFTAVFSSDVDPEWDGGEAVAALSILRSAGHGTRNIDIRTALLWLRRFQMPRYGVDGDNTPITLAPRKCGLIVKNSGMEELAGNAGTGPLIVCVMEQCEITYEAFFPSNIPRLTTVQLAFSQVPQYMGSVRFPDAPSLPLVDDFSVQAPNGWGPLPFGGRIDSVRGRGE